MKVSANVHTIVKDFTFTLDPEEVKALRESLHRERVHGGKNYFFAVDLMNAIDEAEWGATGVRHESPDTWYAKGNGDEDLRNGRKILSIKECRQATGCGLKDAKVVADAREVFLGLR